eukprot:sb/3473117/
MLVASKLRSVCSRLAPLKSPVLPPSRLASDEFNDNPFDLDEKVVNEPVVLKNTGGVNPQDVTAFQERVNEFFNRKYLIKKGHHIHEYSGYDYEELQAMETPVDGIAGILQDFKPVKQVAQKSKSSNPVLTGRIVKPAENQITFPQNCSIKIIPNSL